MATNFSKNQVNIANKNFYGESYSEKNFIRLNTWLRSEGFTVEEVSYSEIAKQEGLLRCSTLPLIRD